MLRIVTSHYKNLHEQLVDGEFGITPDNYSRLTGGGGFFGVSTKMIRNMYVLFAKLVDEGEIKLTWAFDEKVFRHFLSMAGLSDHAVEGFKYVGDSDRLQTRASIKVKVANVQGNFVEVSIYVMNDLIGDDKAVISTSTAVIGTQRINLHRRRFDLMVDNPLHVVYGMIEARKKAEKVIISFNSPGYPSRTRESETLHRAAIELFNVVCFHSPAGSTTNRNILGSGYSNVTNYAANSAIMAALHADSPTAVVLMFDFTDIEEFKMSSLIRNTYHLNYSLFPMGRLRPSSYYNGTAIQRYELSDRIATLMLKATRENIAERQKNPTAPEPVGGDQVIIAETLSDVLRLEKDFHLSDTVVSKKTVVGSLRTYYTDIGGVPMVLVRSMSKKIVDKKWVWSISLTDMRNGVEVIRCEATVTELKKDGETYKVEPITLFEPMADNNIDPVIFGETISGLLSNGKTVIIRKNDGSKFSLHPKLFEKLKYVNDRGDSTDDRIRSQMIACFMDITEVELKPKLGSDIRGYQFLAEPQR